MVDAPAVWSQGDDGLTLRLRDAVEAVFRDEAAPLRIVPGPDQLTIKVTGWRVIGSRTQVRYSVRFYRDGHEIGHNAGHCWDSEMSVCASRIFKADTKIGGPHAQRS